MPALGESIIILRLIVRRSTILPSGNRGGRSNAVQCGRLVAGFSILPALADRPDDENGDSVMASLLPEFSSRLIELVNAMSAAVIAAKPGIRGMPKMISLEQAANEVVQATKALAKVGSTEGRSPEWLDWIVPDEKPAPMCGMSASSWHELGILLSDQLRPLLLLSSVTVEERKERIATLFGSLDAMVLIAGIKREAFLLANRAEASRFSHRRVRDRPNLQKGEIIEAIHLARAKYLLDRVSNNIKYPTLDGSPSLPAEAAELIECLGKLGLVEAADAMRKDFSVYFAHEVRLPNTALDPRLVEFRSKANELFGPFLKYSPPEGDREVVQLRLIDHFDGLRITFKKHSMLWSPLTPPTSTAQNSNDPSHVLKGVSLQAIAAYIRKDDPEGQRQLVKKWQNRRNAKANRLPAPIGTEAGEFSHTQRYLYKPSELLEFLKKVEGEKVVKDFDLNRVIYACARDAVALPQEPEGDRETV